MATKSRKGRFLSDLAEDGPPKKKRKSVGNKRQQLEILAPCPILEGLPDNIMLCIMSLLDLQSLVNLSRVCVRFHHLYSDESIWSSVDLTRESIGCKLDPNKLKKIIRFHLSEFVRCVKLSSNANSLSSNKPAVTESVLDLLFERCPNITSIALHKCDMTILSKSCSLYHATKLERLSFVECKTSHLWIKDVSPFWPNLTQLSFEGSTMIGDSDVEHIGSSPCGKYLRRLNLKGCYRVSKELLLKVCSQDFVELRFLDVRNCSDEITKSVKLDFNELKHVPKCCTISVTSLGALAYLYEALSWRNRPRRGESLNMQKRRTTFDRPFNAMLSLPGIFFWRDLLLNSSMAVCCSTYTTQPRTLDRTL